MKKKMRVLLVFLSTLTLIPLEVRCDFYKYIDKSGIVHFVDSISKVPKEYHNDLESHTHKRYDPLSSKERKKLLDNERAQRKKMVQSYLAKELETKVVIVNNQVLVPVQIGYSGREIKTFLLLDTGASITLLHRKIARQLGLRSLEEATSEIADGTLIKTDIAKLSHMTVGPFKKKDIHVAFLKNDSESNMYAGLLGMNFLRDFEYSIDFERNVIKWKRPF